MIQMIVEGIGIDQGNRTLVLLRDEERRRFLPIWIGPAEAVAIAMVLEKQQAPRPMTHDLITNLLTELDARVVQVVVSGFEESTFFATLTVEHGNQLLEIDSRPSDAIALALRAEADIFVAEEVADQAAVVLEEGQKPFFSGSSSEGVHTSATAEEISRLSKLLDGVNLDDDAQPS